MRDFFTNLLVVVFLVGILTRFTNYILNGRVKREYFVSFALYFLILIPVVSLTLGFDVAISVYLIALLIWLLIDHLNYESRRKGKK